VILLKLGRFLKRGCGKDAIVGKGEFSFGSFSPQMLYTIKEL